MSAAKRAHVDSQSRKWLISAYFATARGMESNHVRENVLNKTTCVCVCVGGGGHSPNHSDSLTNSHRGHRSVDSHFSAVRLCFPVDPTPRGCYGHGPCAAYVFAQIDSGVNTIVSSRETCIEDMAFVGLVDSTDGWSVFTFTSAIAHSQ
jgi:hypothetical protein